MMKATTEPSPFTTAFQQDLPLSAIIERMTTALQVNSIYCQSYRPAPHRQLHQLYVVLRPGSALGLVGSRAMCDLILEERDDIRALVVPASDITKKNLQGSLRTRLIFQPDNLMYLAPDAPKEPILPAIEPDTAMEQAVSYFEKEMTRIRAFEQGFLFYLRKGNLSQSAFMLHQTIELGLRTAESLLIGKEKITHSLRNHQDYIAPFSPKLGHLFTTPAELISLEKLDTAYKATRYEHDFRINVIELIVASAKADIVIHQIHRLQDILIRDIQSITGADANVKDVTTKFTKFVPQETPISDKLCT